jgi:transcriptional regulator of heat shock response
MTDRQTQILLAIIREFMITASPIGSVILYEKYHIKASPATIRNEMVSLAELGYLEKTHFSAGRIPTTTGFRYYIDRLMHEELVDYMQEVELRQLLHAQRFQRDKLIKMAVDNLADTLKYAAVALADDTIFYSGISEILDYPEFQDIDNLKSILGVIENYSILKNVFGKAMSDNDIKVLVGEETGFRSFSPCAVVYAEFRLYQGQVGFIGVIGPIRMDYAQVIPHVRFVADTLSSVTRGW